MRYLDTLEARQTMKRLAIERAAQTNTIVTHLIDDGGYDELNHTVLGLFHSLTPSQCALMLVEL